MPGKIQIRAVARPRRVPGRMNQTEREFAIHLEAMKSSGGIVDWAFEPETLRLADRTTYTPDFRLIYPDGAVEFVEVKGSWKAPHQEDARVKWKTAAELHWMYRFRAVEFRCGQIVTDEVYGSVK